MGKPEWLDGCRLPIIGIAAFRDDGMPAAGAGKDTFAKAVAGRYGYSQYIKVDLEKLAYPLYQIDRHVFGWAGEEAQSRLSGYKEGLDPYFGITRRQAKQHIGTDLFRAWMDDIWIRSLFLRVACTILADDACSDVLRLSPRKADDGGVIRRFLRRGVFLVTDVRFDNEARAITDVGGGLIRLQTARSSTGPGIREHESEQALHPDQHFWDITFRNDGAKEDLLAAVQESEQLRVLLNDIGSGPAEMNPRLYEVAWRMKNVLDGKTDAVALLDPVPD